jgi:hypothetical protein
MAYRKVASSEALERLLSRMEAEHVKEACLRLAGMRLVEHDGTLRRIGEMVADRLIREMRNGRGDHGGG